MTHRKLTRRDDGFTIIEVLIVLAIAGLIMLIVFLAVPKLQQSARNTQRTQDSANLLASVSEFVNDNNGDLPTGGTITVNADKTTTIAATGESSITGAKMGYYLNGNIKIIADETGETSADSDHLYVVLNHSCSGNSASTSSSRAIAAVYYIEPGSVKQCKD